MRANWMGFVILLAMPMCITALVGTVFGPSARNNEVPRIKIAYVNEDENALGNFLAGGLVSEQAQEFLDVTVTDRDTALRLINDNEISAVLIVPENFSQQYLSGEHTPDLELIKNPAQSFMPAITEELVRVMVEALNAVSLNLRDELPEISKVFDDSDSPDMLRLARTIEQLGEKIERAEGYVFPPVIGYKESVVESADSATDSDSGFNVFAFVMPGLVAMFLLFTADTAARDLIVERRSKTLTRFRTFRTGLLSFFVAKSFYVLTVTLIAACIMMIGGGLIFGIDWVNPAQIAVLTMSYSAFSVGFAFLIVSVVYRERLISIFSSVTIMLIAFFGGSMLPSNSLPPFIRNMISPYMPNYVFAEAIKRLQFDRSGPHWATATMVLAVTGVVMLVVSVFLFQRRLNQGAQE